MQNHIFMHVCVNCNNFCLLCDPVMLLYYRTPVDRDYNKMTEQNFSQVLIHYGVERFGDLTDVAIAPTGEIVIVDHGNGKVIILDDRLNLLNVIGQGSGDSRLVRPYGVAVTDNVIAVSDWYSHQVKKYLLQGNLLSVIGCFGNKNGQFSDPRGLTFNNNKLLYVVDGYNHRVQVFNKDDTFAFSFGSKGNNPGQFRCPLKISIDPNNNVLVTDCLDYANGINIFTHDGQFVQAIKSNGSFAITISPSGYLITSHDGYDNIIRVWSPTYQLINQFGKRGKKQRKFNGIVGMAIDSRGTVYTVECDNNRLQISYC